MAIADNLVVAWELDEASGNALDSVGSNHAVETSGTIGAASGPGGSGGSRDFEAGDTEYFEVADNATVSTGDIDVTKEVWVNGETIAGFPVVIGKGWNNAAPREWVLYCDTSDGGKLVYTVETAGGVTAEARWGTNPSTATWYQVLMWHDSVNNLIGISVNNGTPVTTAHSGGIRDSAMSFQIGASERAGTQSLYWDGLIAKARIWKRVLTSDERTWLYNGGTGRTYAQILAGIQTPKPQSLVRSRAVNRASFW